MDRLLHNLPHTDAIRDEPFRRIEVITGVERRRRWSEQDKARIVAESLKPGVIVAEVARRYGMHRNQLYGWRSAFGVQRKRHLLTTLRGGSSPARMTGWFPERELDQAASAV